MTLRYIIGNREAERFWKKLGFQPVITTAKTVLDRLKSGTSVSNSAIDQCLAYEEMRARGNAC